MAAWHNCHHNYPEQDILGFKPAREFARNSKVVCSSRNLKFWYYCNSSNTHIPNEDISKTGKP
jgi:hypothetical protein